MRSIVKGRMAGRASEYTGTTVSLDLLVWWTNTEVAMRGRDILSRVRAHALPLMALAFRHGAKL